jgi:hypothetical protein
MPSAIITPVKILCAVFSIIQVPVAEEINQRGAPQDFANSQISTLFQVKTANAGIELPRRQHNKLSN